MSNPEHGRERDPRRDLERRLVEELVRHASPSGHERGASEFLVSWLSERGLRAYVDEAGSACAVWGQGPIALCLLGHIDTVPGEIPVRVEDGILHGRGAVDAKGPLAAFASALARVAGSMPAPRGGSVLLVGAVEEEAATSKGARQVVERLAGGPPPAATIIGEPSGWDKLTLGYRGRLRGSYSVVVDCAHAASDQATAPELAFEYWQRVRALADEYNSGPEAGFDSGSGSPDGAPRSPFFRLSPSLLSFASESDGLQDRAALDFGIRLPPEWDPAELEEVLRESAEMGEVRFWGQERAHLADRNTPLVRSLLRSMRSQGCRPRFSLKTGTSDMNVVAPAWQTPIVAYGPGDPNLSHTPHEKLELAEFDNAVAVLERVIREHVAGEAR